MIKIEVTSAADKFLSKLLKSNVRDGSKINLFIDKMRNNENPCALPNAKKLSGFNDNRYRWALGNWRVIGTVKNGEITIITIIEIARRNSTTYSHTKG